ncbi:DUF1330 domain-containing protein [Agaribacter marinus]|uniref:DUF1330 domain-containing protein n=1 Tax=Agaribacter marinus TaxID=1431249 RepID=A0AA37SXB8_9ALTE|nr:DUF1330 domain-containing protein [Agaribacter marinus]GLR69341.1 hypothetical protein GCM10007852_02490 [Agaribacter marinus]
MSFERIMGLEVINDSEYQLYRENMAPILHSFGGSFGFDFVIDRVLKSKTEHVINRVFTIDFPSKKIMDAFFSDPAYLAVKEQYFNRSVKSVTTISMHEKSKVND